MNVLWIFLLTCTAITIKPCFGFSISSSGQNQRISAESESNMNMDTKLSMSSSSSTSSSSSKDEEYQSPQNIVIAGAGIIGTSTAYYLSQIASKSESNENNQIKSITLIDPTGTIAPAASGKAGGFLALDWNDYSPVGPLARRSFELHSQLAEELGKDKIMYRRLTCASISVRENGKARRPSGKKLVGVEWASDLNLEDSDTGSGSGSNSGDEAPTASAVGYRSLGDEETIAQVHPKMLCDAMWERVQENCRSSGIETCIIKGKVKSAVHNENDALIGAKLDDRDGTIINADAILYACGPWTEYGKCMVGVKYHSAIIETKNVLSQSVFYDGFGDPEIYPRPDKTAYCCGFPDPATKVVERPGEEEVRQEKVDEIVQSVRAASGGVDGVLGKDPKIAQSCYLPTTPDNLPMMGTIEENGCFVAAGHGCWGILMGPASGEAMASLILNNESAKVDLRPFRPGRFVGM